jgi:serine/threonine protein kinase
MDPERWQQIDQLFQGSLDLEPERRSAFLDEACRGDQELRDKVELLLASDAAEWKFVNQPALELAATLLVDDRPQLQPGQKVAHYEIISLIGTGGMGEVYLAYDEILKRKVALKLLLIDYSEEKDRMARFQREALAASGLNHPNILTIYEQGTADGQLFIATEFVDGETLRQRMKRGRLRLTELLDIAVQTAGALAAAHQAGIVHRDVKPENIMLRPDGYVKVLDFGLAKLTEGLEATALSAPDHSLDISSGLLMGTAKYMSPEQARGLRVDQRSDIFSFGVVHYEIITGNPPFQGETASQVIESILEDDPPALTGSRPDLPLKLIEIVERTLQKSRKSRYQTAAELYADLKAVKEEWELKARLHPAPRDRGIDATDLDPELRPEDLRAGRATMPFDSLMTGVTARPVKVTILLLALIIVVGSLFYFFGHRRKAETSPGSWITKQPLLRPRRNAAVAGLDGKLYVASGVDDSHATNAFEVYDPATDKWSARAPIPTIRGDAGASGINGIIYVFGGAGLNSEGNEDGRVGLTNIVEAYDPRTDSWTRKTPMPTARTGMSWAVIDGKLYVAGGVGPCPPCPFYRMLEVYDPATDKWETKSPMPGARVFAGGAAINGRFYVAGGAYADGVREPADKMEVYDPATDKWSVKDAAMPTPRSALGVVSVHDILYAIGGGTSYNPRSSAVEAYDPSTNQWTIKAPLPTPRDYLLQPIAIAGTIYLAGGSSRNLALSTFEAYTAPCPGSTCVSAPQGLIGWWPGDGSANDIARASHGAIQGAVTFGAGRVDQAFNFNGSSFVTTGNPAPLNLSGSEVTIAGWINPRLNDSAIYFGKTEYGSSDYCLLFSQGLHGTIKAGGVELEIFSYADFPSNTKPFSPPTNQWTHVALTYDGSLMKIYANGKLVGQESKTGKIDGNNVPFNIGGRAVDNGTGRFNGLIDEVQVFNRALSQAELQSIYDSGGAGMCKFRTECP